MTTCAFFLESKNLHNKSHTKISKLHIKHYISYYPLAFTEQLNFYWLLCWLNNKTFIFIGKDVHGSVPIHVLDIVNRNIG